VSVVVVGVSHRTVPLDVLERMAIARADLPKVLANLAAHEHLGEVVVLATCHRTEVYAVAERFHGAVQDIRNVLSEWSFLPPEAFTDRLLTYHDEVAATHLFEVAAGLDSVVLGESEVLGQVKEAWEVARAQGVAGPALSSLFRHALEVGKRARAETGIARGVTSVSQAAVAMAVERLGPLAGRRILVLGAGEMGEGMAVALGAAGAEVLVANRTWAKAVELAGRVGGEAVPLAGLQAALSEVDLVLTSTGSPAAILDRGDLLPVTAARAGRPLLIVDVAVPRDIDPSVAELPGVTLLGVDDLRAFAAAGLDERRKEVTRVRGIVEQEVARYLDHLTAREVAPTIAALRDHAEEVRRAELERLATRLAGLDDREREAVEALTRGILGKLLHEPSVRLKEASGTPRGERLADALRTLFDLE
jgi:glutamyl-tRNA reductase